MQGKHHWDSDTYTIQMTAEELENLVILLSELSHFDDRAAAPEKRLREILINT